MEALLIFTGILVSYCLVLVLILWAHNRHMDRFNRTMEEANELRKANRTPEEIDNDARGACVALCGFDPGPSARFKKEPT